MKRLFLKTKPSAVLLLLKDSQQSWYPSKLARESNSSYVHTVNLLSHLRKLGIATVEKKGKQNIYRLTEKGAYLASALDDFSKKCDAADAEAKAAAQKAAQAEAAAAAQPAAQHAPHPAHAAQPAADEKKEEKKQDAEKNSL